MFYEGLMKIHEKRLIKALVIRPGVERNISRI
jgi:hypothetical protein